jgi:endogenous inhibitor of DNA gyrase (YacG/DUF329 family)
MSPSEAAAPDRSPRCPTCGRSAAWPANPARPFCSIACKLVDLGRWLDGGYRVPGEPLPGAPHDAETANRAGADASD